MIYFYRPQRDFESRYGCLYELRASKDIEVALYNLRRAVREGDAERGEDWLIARRCLSELLLKLHKGEEVLSDYKKWVEEEPENVTAICSYTWALQRMGRKEEAWMVLETAIKIDEHNDGVLEGAGDLCWGFGRYEEAISYYDRISKDSESISHLFSKAEVLALMGEKEKAIQQFEQILVWLEEKGYNLEVEGQHPREDCGAVSAELIETEGDSCYMIQFPQIRVPYTLHYVIVFSKGSQFFLKNNHRFQLFKELQRTRNFSLQEYSPCRTA